MKCPYCSETFELTWRRYFRPGPKLRCPHCGKLTRMVHGWTYYAILAAGCLVVTLGGAGLLALLQGWRWPVIGGAAAVWLGAAVPFDRWFESRCVLEKFEPKDS